MLCNVEMVEVMQKKEHYIATAVFSTLTVANIPSLGAHAK